MLDTGLPGSAPLIARYLEKRGRDIAEIRRIILTHYHPDHAGSAAELFSRSGAKVAAHSADAGYISGQSPPPNPFVWRPLAALAQPAFDLFPIKPAPVEERLEDGDELDVWGGIRVVHIPGHTPGSIALFSESKAFLMVGDALQNRFNRLSLPSRLFTVDMALAKRSVERLAKLEFDILCFSHFPPILDNPRRRVQALAATL